MANQRTLSRGELTAETTPAASNGMKRIIFVPKEIKIGQDQDQDQVLSGFRLMPPGEARAWWRHRVFRPTGRDPGTEKWRWRSGVLTLPPPPHSQAGLTPGRFSFFSVSVLILPSSFKEE